MEGKKKAAFVDIIVVGFAMFAVFFGAGNLIFPPYLGMMSGEKWILGFLCFILADAGLAISTVLVMIRGDGSISAIVGRLGRKASWLISTISMLCVGPLICREQQRLHMKWACCLWYRDLIRGCLPACFLQLFTYLP